MSARVSPAPRMVENQLVDLLTEAYPDRRIIEFVLHRAEIDTSAIDLSGPTKVIWHHAWQGAKRAGRERALIDEVRGDKSVAKFHPEIEQLWRQLNGERAATTWETPPSSATLKQIALWLDRDYRRPLARKGLLDEAGVRLDAQASWLETLSMLSTQKIRVLLEAAGDPEEVKELLALLEQPGPPGDDRAAKLEQALTDTLAARFQDAASLFESEQYESAAKIYTNIAGQLSGMPESEQIRADRARAILNQAAALNRLGDFAQSEKLLRIVEPADLKPRGRINMGRLLVGLGDQEGALRAIDGLVEPGAEIVRQLVGLAQGTIPDNPADDPDVLLWSAVAAFNDRRSAATIEFALRASRTEPINERGRQHAADLLGRSLFLYWLGESREEVPSPGVALRRLEELARTSRKRADWKAVDDLVLLCNDLPPTSEPPDEPSSEQAPAWLAELQDAMAEPDAGRLRGVVAKWPHVGPVLITSAQGLLAAGHVEEALTLARRAFERLPGHGQRQVLAMALVSAGAGPELDQHLEVLATRKPRPEHTLEIAVRAALARERLDEALKAVSNWNCEHPASLGPPVWEVLVRLRRAEVPEARAAALRVLEFPNLSFEVLRALAAAAFAIPADRELARRLAVALEREDLRQEPEAEMLRYQLLLASGSSSSIPIDWSRLQEAGQARWVSLDEALEVFRAQAKVGELADKGWQAGIVAFEWWAEQHDLPACAFGLGITRGEEGLVPPVPAAEPPPWRGKRVYLGALGIEVLVAMGLHAAFGDAIGGLVVLEDSSERFAEGAADTFVASLQIEREETERRWLPFEGLPIIERGAPTNARLSENDVPAVAAWLGSPDLTHPAQDPWVPPAEVVVLDVLAIVGLHRRKLSERFLAACQKNGVIVGIDRESVDARNARRREIVHRTDAAQLAAKAWRWLAELRSAGRLEVREIPSGPPLPSGPDAPDPLWVSRSFAARELLLLDPELVVVSSELIELGVNGYGPVPLLADRAWTAETRAEHQKRYAGLGGRHVTLAQVVQELLPPEALERRAEVIGQLARSGYADALTGADIRALYRRFQGLAVEEARAQLLGTVRSLRAEVPVAHAALLASFATLPLADAIAETWSEAEGPASMDIEARVNETLSILDATSAMDQDSRGRHRILDTLLSFLAGQTVRRQEWFSGGNGIEHIGQRLWRAIGSWAESPGKVVSAQLAVAQAIRQEPDRLGVGELRYGILVRVLPLHTRPGMVDLSGIATAAILNRRAAYPNVLTGFLRVGNPPRALEEWRAAAVRAPDMDLDGTDLEGIVDGVLVRLALEGALPEILPRAAEFAEQLLFDDGCVATALARWAENQNAASLQALRVALDKSPLRAIRADPRVILGWSRWADPGTLGPRSIAELRSLLAESDDLPSQTGIIPVIDARLAPGGVWHDRDQLSIARQLARIPGGLLGIARPEIDEGMLRSLARLPEDHADYPTGEMVGALLALGIAGKADPVRRLDDIDVRLPDLVARAAAAVLTPSPDAENDYARYEPGLVRVCGMVVDALTTEPLDNRQRIWLVWRLFSWLTTQIFAGADALESAKQLAQLAPPAKSEGPDPYDAHRAGPGHIDIRELSVLHVLFRLRSDGAVDWSLLQPVLLRVASRKLTPDERELREEWSEPSLGGVALLAPDLARLLALRADLDVVSQLDPIVRMAWLDDALRVRPDEHPLQPITGSVLASFSLHAHRWSDAEADRIQTALVAIDPSRDVGRSLLLVAASGRWPTDGALEIKARSIAFSRLTESPSDQRVVQEWLLASARAGHLKEAVRELRAELSTRAIDELPFLAGLSRPLLDPEQPVRDQARAVLADLATEPHLAEAEFFRLLLEPSGDTAAK